MSLSHQRSPALDPAGGSVETETLAPPTLSRSMTTVLPYPVILSPVPTKLISVNPVPTLASDVITPDDGFTSVDPIPTPATNRIPSL